MQVTKPESSDVILARWYQEGLDELRKGKQLALKHQTTFEVIIDNVDSHRKLMPEWQQASFAVHGFACRHGWQIAVDIAVDTFKDPVAVSIIDFILHAFPDNGQTETSDYADIGHRDVSFSVEGLEATVSMRLRGEGTESCRRVLTGVKTIERREYEFKCD